MLIVAARLYIDATAMAVYSDKNQMGGGGFAVGARDPDQGSTGFVSPEVTRLADLASALSLASPHARFFLRPVQVQRASCMWSRSRMSVAVCDSTGAFHPALCGPSQGRIAACGRWKALRL